MLSGKAAPKRICPCGEVNRYTSPFATPTKYRFPMILNGSAGSRMFVICARISSDLAAICLPCSASAAVKGGLGAMAVCATSIAPTEHSSRPDPRTFRCIVFPSSILRPRARQKPADIFIIDGPQLLGVERAAFHQQLVLFSGSAKREIGAEENL